MKLTWKAPLGDLLVVQGFKAHHLEPPQGLFLPLQVGFMGSLSCLCLGLYGSLGFRFSRTTVRIWLRTGAVNANGYKPPPVTRMWCRCLGHELNSYFLGP